jgi:hypothetical protein
MARKYNTTARKVTFDMEELAKYIEGKSNEQLGEWFRKAVKDCLEGCASQDVDCLVKKMYEASLCKMQKRQNINANYRNRIARKNNEDALHREANDGDSTGRNAGAINRTTVFNDYDSAKSQGESNTGSTLPVVRPESGIIYDQENTPISTNEARQSQTDAGAISLSGLNSEKADRHCAATAPASNILQLDTSKKPYGTCGHVMLTDAEGHHLRIVYGENLKIAIDILDAYIENNGKAAKKYKNHAAVLRKGNWVYEKVQNMILAQKRIDNVSNGHAKDFKTMREDEQRRRAFTSLYETTEAL